MSSAVTYPYIVCRREALSGKPHVEGTRIRVSDIMVQHVYGDQSPEQIRAAFPHLTLAQIHSALAYYHDHKEEIHAEVDEAAGFAEAFRKNHPGTVIGPE